MKETELQSERRLVRKTIANAARHHGQATGLRGARFGADGSVVPGDLIVAVNGQLVDGVPRLLARLDDYQVGEGVRVTVLRDGQKVDLTITLRAGG